MRLLPLPLVLARAARWRGPQPISTARQNRFDSRATKGASLEAMDCGGYGLFCVEETLFVVFFWRSPRRVLTEPLENDVL